MRLLQLHGVLFAVIFACCVGCGTDNTPTLPENMTETPPDVGFSTGGDEGDAPGETQALKPR